MYSPRPISRPVQITLALSTGEARALLRLVRRLSVADIEKALAGQDELTSCDAATAARRVCLSVAMALGEV